MVVNTWKFPEENDIVLNAAGFWGRTFLASLLISLILDHRLQFWGSSRKWGQFLPTLCGCWEGSMWFSVPRSSAYCSAQTKCSVNLIAFVMSVPYWPHGLVSDLSSWRAVGRGKELLSQGTAWNVKMCPEVPDLTLEVQSQGNMNYCWSQCHLSLRLMSLRETQDARIFAFLYLDSSFCVFHLHRAPDWLERTLKENCFSTHTALLTPGVWVFSSHQIV